MTDRDASRGGAPLAIPWPPTGRFSATASPLEPTGATGDREGAPTVAAPGPAAARYLRALGRAATTLSLAPTPEHTCQAAVQLLVEAFDAVLAQGWRYEPATETIEPRGVAAAPGIAVGTTDAFAGLAPWLTRVAQAGVPHVLPVTRRDRPDPAVAVVPEAGAVALEAGAVVPTDATAAPVVWGAAAEDLLDRVGVVAVTAVPIEGDGVVRGVLVHHARQPLGPELLDALTTIAALVAAALGGQQLARERQVAVAVSEQRQQALAAAAEEHQLLAQAEAAESRFRGLLESAPDAILLVDAQGRIELVNRQTETLFGYPRGELLGQAVELLVPERLRAAHHQQRAHYQLAPVTRPMGAGLALFGRRKDGSEFPVEISLSPMETAGEPLVISIIRDVTERKRAEVQLQETAAALAGQTAELERSNAELQQFAYVASHDLQEPLRMVASYTQLLARRYRGQLGPDADDFIAYAVDGATRMQELIDDLLTYSRVGTRGKPLALTSSAEVLDRVHADLSAAIAESGATITHDPLPVVRADPLQLGQVFQNLLANAIKFRGILPPHVHVSADRHADQWRFAVRDNGVGIDPRYAERIFVIFQRLHTREEYPGSGIGLAICKKIVERHGGQIWLESQLGRGATFYFTLPGDGEGLP